MAGIASGVFTSRPCGYPAESEHLQRAFRTEGLGILVRFTTLGMFLKEVNSFGHVLGFQLESFVARLRKVPGGAQKALRIQIKD